MDRAAHQPLGRVYRWEIPGGDEAPRAVCDVVPLSNLIDWSPASRGLRGRFAVVYDAAVINLPGLGPGDSPRPTPVGDAMADERGNLMFDPGRGGGRIDKITVADPAFRSRYLQAARFGEVNTYFHVDRIAAYVGALLDELGAPALPPVTAVVNAHGAGVDVDGDANRDGRRCPDGRWVPFQGGHYRLPGLAARIPEDTPLSPDGEIHLGPGQKLARHGALAARAGGPYRANASHNPAIIFHEYGHHICRHTADFRANRRRPAGRQSNRKTALDEGSADYWTATMLGTPHIWFFHHRHDPTAPHRRSLVSRRTMADFAPGKTGDAHANGTIWAAALWDLRTEAIRREDGPQGGRRIDRLLLQALLLIGADGAGDRSANDDVPALVRARRSFRRAGAALLEADAILHQGALRDAIARVLAARGIHPEGSRLPAPFNATAATS